MEALIELAGADRLAGASAGQQPWGGALVSGGGVTLAGGDQVKDESGEWFGKCDGFPAEPQVYFAAAGLDVTESEAADGGGLLGVEQDDNPKHRLSFHGSGGRCSNYVVYLGAAYRNRTDDLRITSASL